MLLQLLSNPAYSIIDLKSHNRLLRMARCFAFDHELIVYALKMLAEDKVTDSNILCSTLEVLELVIENKYMCPLMREEADFKLILNGLTDEANLQKINALATSNEIELLRIIIQTTLKCIDRIHANYDGDRLAKANEMIGGLI
jgi:hypothetical protein